jgi:DeoR/GlpR family transcriptional regulator of sugar metabolism
MLSYKERQEVLADYLRRYSGRKFIVGKLAKLLGVCERTIQKHLADLETGGVIKRIAGFIETGRQDGNVIVYTGPESSLSSDGLTIEDIYGCDCKPE